MRNPEIFDTEPKYPSLFERAIITFGIFAVIATGVTAMLAPAAATSADSAMEARSADATAYFPDQYVNKASEIEPMPATF